MPFYALSTIPLIRRLPNNVTQARYADDASACGEVIIIIIIKFTTMEGIHKRQSLYKVSATKKNTTTTKIYNKQIITKLHNNTKTSIKTHIMV